MAKLYEALAAEKDIKNRTHKVQQEGTNTFRNKPDHFSGHVKVYTSLNEEDKGGDDALCERKEIVTTVAAKLNYVLKHSVDLIDHIYQKDLSNGNARADIVVEGATIASDVPALTLLSLTTQFRTLRDMCDGIPTLPPGIKWIPAPDKGEGYYQTADPEVRMRTRKDKIYKIVVPATDRHPAQTSESIQEVNVGKYVETKFSGMITPAEKSKLLDKIDKLIIGIEKALSRANSQELADGQIAEKLFNFILS